LIVSVGRSTLEGFAEARVFGLQGDNHGPAITDVQPGGGVQRWPLYAKKSSSAGGWQGVIRFKFGKIVPSGGHFYNGSTGNDHRFITTTGDLSVTTDNTIWIGQNGEKYGPYSEASVRQWMAEGKFAPDALAWRDGMPDWVPLSHFFFTAPGAAPQPPPPPAFRTQDHAYGGNAFSAQRYDQTGYAETGRADMPTPPSLHWGLVLLFSILSFGIFAIVWPFIQASWVRRIDPESKSRMLLIIALICFVIGEPIYWIGLTELTHGTGGSAGLGGLLLLARWILYLVAYFSMAGSIERVMSRYGIRPEIGRITLFFFPMFYLQAQLSWLARWKETGQTSPAASKGSIWALVLIVPFIAILAAIAIPAYQSYVVRTQVAEGMALADGAKTAFSAYYNNRHTVPSDNAAAGLAPDTSITGRYVSSVDVSGGKITVAFDSAAANATIRDKVLVLSPETSGSQITWTCSAESTVPARDLPLGCRR
jgi:Tfp pilus assembly major pilin PilA